MADSRIARGTAETAQAILQSIINHESSFIAGSELVARAQMNQGRALGTPRSNPSTPDPEPLDQGAVSGKAGQGCGHGFS